MIIKKWTNLFFSVSMLFLILVSAAYSSDTQILTLKNGMTLMLTPDRSSPMVSISAIVKFGARNENPDTYGAAHFIEHLIFNGTPKRTQEQLYKDVDLLGAYNNASTDRAATTFLMIVPSEFAENAMEIQGDMLLHSILPQEKFEKEKGIIIEEIGKQSVDTYSLAEEFFDSKIVSSSGYNHPILGSKESIQDMSRDKLLSLYKTFYNPSNIILKINGNFTIENIKKVAEKYYSKESTVGHITQPEPDMIAYDRTLNILNAKPIQINYYSFALPAPGAESRDLPAFMLLNDVLNNRLNKVLKPNFPIPIMRISSDYIPFEKTGYLKITVMTPPMGDPSTVASALLNYIERFAFAGLDEATLRIMITGFKTAEAIASEKPHIYTFSEGTLIAVGGAEILQSISNTIPWLSIEDIVPVKNKYFEPLRFSAAAVCPGDSDTAAVSKITITPKMIENASSFISSEKMMQKGATPIVRSETGKQASEKKMLEKKLGNGLHIGVIQSPDSQVFAVHILFRNRSSLEPQGKTGIAALLNRLLMSGTGLTDASGIGQIADAMGLVLTSNDNPMIPFDDIYTQPTFSFIRLETSSGFWKPSLSFLYNIMYHSSFPEKELEQKKGEQISLITKNASLPSEKAKQEFLKGIFGEDHPLSLSTLGTSATVSSITKEDLINFRNLYFAPDNIIITISTDQNADEIAAEIQRLFGEEKAALVPQEVKAFTYIEQHAKGTFEIPTGKKQSYIYYGYLIPYEKDKMYSLIAANSIISDKLAFQLREKEGLAYSLGSSIEFYRHNALFTFTIGTSPENISKAVEGIGRELKDLENYRPTDEELLKTVRMYIGRLKMRTLSRINQAYYAGIGLFFYRDSEYLDNLSKGLSDIDANTTAASIKTIVSASNPYVIIAK